MPRLYVIGKLQSATMLRFNLLTDYVDSDRDAAKTDLEVRISQADSEIDKLINRYERLIGSPEDRRLFGSLKSALGPYRKGCTRVLLLSRGRETAEAQRMMAGSVVPLRNAV